MATIRNIRARAAAALLVGTVLALACAFRSSSSEPPRSSETAQLPPVAAYEATRDASNAQLQTVARMKADAETARHRGTLNAAQGAPAVDPNRAASTPVFQDPNEFTERWSKGKSDPRWSAEVEDLAQGVFEGLEIAGSPLVVACRETLCFVSLEVGDMNEARELATSARMVDDERWAKLSMLQGAPFK